MARSYYPTDYNYLNITRGLVKGTEWIHKFGAVPQIDNSATGTLWDKASTIYPWSAWDTPGILTITTHSANDSSSTEDDGKTIRIIGLDENFNDISEDITISGSSGNGTKTFARVYRAFVIGSIPNATTVKVFRGVTEVLRIQIGLAQTLMAIYTVPAGYTGYLMKGQATVQSGEGATVQMFVRFFGGTFRIQHQAEVAGNGGPYDYDFILPSPIPEKSDIDVRMIARTNNIRASAIFDIILIEDKLGQ